MEAIQWQQLCYGNAIYICAYMKGKLSFSILYTCKQINKVIHTCKISRSELSRITKVNIQLLHLRYTYILSEDFISSTSKSVTIMSNLCNTAENYKL